MRAVIVTGGAMRDFACLRQFIRADDYIVAADGGYRHAVALGVTPNILVGDFDSLDELPDGIEIHCVPEDKDFTDTELALEYARKRGCSDFLFLGAIGSRMDHSLSNIFLLADCLERGETAKLVDEHNCIWITDSETEVHAPPGSILSLVPLCTCTGVTTENLAYPLCDATIYLGKARTVSNIVLATPARVSVASGQLLLMLCRD